MNPLVEICSLCQQSLSGGVIVRPVFAFSNKTWRFPGVFFLVFILAVILFSSSCCRKVPPTNVLLFTFDTLRADHLGCYGFQQAKTPVLDELAQKGVLFENAFCQVPLTLPSHASILTGLYPPSHGVRLNGPYYLPPNVPTLAGILKQNGYSTAAFVSAFVLDSQFGLDRGFDVYDDDTREQSSTYMAERTAELTTQRVIEWLGQRQEYPFFLWVHFFDPHLPYVPPAPFDSMFSESPYDGEIAYADKMAGEILNELERLQILDSTCIIATSDHGEGLGEHGEISHSLFVYDTTIHIPLIFALPEKCSRAPTHWSPGSRINDLVETVDLVPTVLDLLGIRSDIATDGTSLLKNEPGAERFVYSESLYPLSHGWSPLQSARTLEWKFIKASKPELYDVRNDAQEVSNQYTRHGEMAAAMETWLGEFPVQSTQSAESSLDPESAAKLRELGYLSGGAARETGDVWSLPDPKDKVALFDRIDEIRVLVNSGQNREGIERLLPVLESEPNNPILLQLLGIAYTQDGEYEKALEFLRLYKTIVETDLEASLDLGIALIQCGSPQEAITHLEQCVESMPTYAAAWDQIGIAYAQTGQTERALDASRRAVQIKPFDPDFAKNYGVTLLCSNRFQDAETQFERAVQIQPTRADLHYHLGLAVNSQAKLAMAEREFKKTIEIQPEHALAKERLIEVYYRLGNKTQVQPLADELIATGQDGAITHFYLGLLRLESGKLAEAMPHLQIAVEGMPAFPLPYESYAEALIQAKGPAERVDWLLEKIEKNRVRIKDEIIESLETLAAEKQ